MLDKNQLAKQLLAWWDEGHISLPWRENPDPYAIWISEIMLQQTQIAKLQLDQGDEGLQHEGYLRIRSICGSRSSIFVGRSKTYFFG